MIRSYDVNNEAVKLLKEALDVFAGGEMIHDLLSRSAHMKGLQGFKRWHRINSKRDRQERVDLQHYIIDMFGENLEPNWEREVNEPLNLTEHLDMYLNWEISVYKDINRIANELVLKGYNHESTLIKACLKGVVKEIEKINRWSESFAMTGYDMPYILIVDRELHNKCKEIE